MNCTIPICRNLKTSSYRGLYQYEIRRIGRENIPLLRRHNLSVAAWIARLPEAVVVPGQGPVPLAMLVWDVFRTLTRQDNSWRPGGEVRHFQMDKLSSGQTFVAAGFHWLFGTTRHVTVLLYTSPVLSHLVFRIRHSMFLQIGLQVLLPSFLLVNVSGGNLSSRLEWLPSVLAVSAVFLFLILTFRLGHDQLLSPHSPIIRKRLKNNPIAEPMAN
ncbi:MAG: hypothetical protein RIK87_13120 [Fuerstiella sp.]